MFYRSGNKQNEAYQFVSLCSLALTLSIPHDICWPSHQYQVDEKWKIGIFGCTFLKVPFPSPLSWSPLSHLMPSSIIERMYAITYTSCPHLFHIYLYHAIIAVWVSPCASRTNYCTYCSRVLIGCLRSFQIHYWINLVSGSNIMRSKFSFKLIESSATPSFSH